MNNFTPRAQMVLALARKEADRLCHNYVGTGHLLLGLIRLGQGTAFNVLFSMGLNQDSVRAEVEEALGAGRDPKAVGNIPFTPRVKKVLALASKEARALHHSYVGTEHLLLGLLDKGDGTAARILRSREIVIGSVRDGILRQLDPDVVPQTDDVRPREPHVSRPPDPPRWARTFWYFTPPSPPGCIVWPATENRWRWWNSDLR